MLFVFHPDHEPNAQERFWIARLDRLETVLRQRVPASAEGDGLIGLGQVNARSTKPHPTDAGLINPDPVDPSQKNRSTTNPRRRRQMNDLATLDAYGVLSQPDTLKLTRLLPGPIERVWAYLTDSDLRRQWLASGEMEMKVGAPVELVWRNDELTNPPGERPAGFPDEHRMASQITELDPPRKLSISWTGSGDVSFELEPVGNKVLLTVTHRSIADRATMLMFGAGWHMHLDILAARATGTEPMPFWDGWSRLMKDYDQRLPA
ncbi:hypothetical protein LPJGGPFB_02931 [Ensifer adhaerens]|nr:hypothetical protein [Ensifer adhaerens]